MLFALAQYIRFYIFVLSLDTQICWVPSPGNTCDNAELPLSAETRQPEQWGSVKAFCHSHLTFKGTSRHCCTGDVAAQTSSCLQNVWDLEQDGCTRPTSPYTALQVTKSSPVPFWISNCQSYTMPKCWITLLQLTSQGKKHGTCR